MLNYGAVVAPYLLLQPPLAFSYFMQLVLIPYLLLLLYEYVPALTCRIYFCLLSSLLVVLMIPSFRHTAPAQQAAAEQQTANTTRGGRWGASKGTSAH